MALTADFWRKDEQLDIFRSKVCTRLSRDGVCQWKSQCQFSHCVDWPRRVPTKHSYSPEVCPNLQVTVGKDGSSVLTKSCTAGRSCPYAHSLEEVLYHPLIFKTTRCEEYANLVKDGDKKKTSKHGKKRCHRYYCPFAHGDQELRTSTLAESQIQDYLSKLDIFPTSDCCNFCVLACRPCNTTSRSSGDSLIARITSGTEDLLPFNPILATAPQPYSNLLALRQAREQASLKEELADIKFSPAFSPLPNPFGFGAQNSPTLSPLSKASDFEEIPDLKDLPPPLKIQVDGYGGASLAPIYRPSQNLMQFSGEGCPQNFTQQKDYREMKDELSARIYAML